MFGTMFTRRATFMAGVSLIAASMLNLSPVYAQSTLEDARKQGFIRVGFANEAPFGYATPEGVLTGESPEIAKIILARLGITSVDGVLTEFGALIPGLKAHRFDIIAAGMFITPKRCQEVAFSEPSYGIGEAMLVQTGNPKGVKDYSTFVENADLKLAIMAGSINVDYAAAAGVPEAQLLVLPDTSSLIAAVQSGRADAAGLAALSIADMAKKAEGVESTAPFSEIAGKPIKAHGGFAFRKEDTSLVDAFNAELKNFIGTPEHLKVVEQFGLDESYLPQKTTAELCGG